MTENNTAQHDAHILANTKSWLRVYIFDIGQSCYGQLTPVKTRFPQTCITGLKFSAH